jgi:hypothetical protein
MSIRSRVTTSAGIAALLAVTGAAGAGLASLTPASSASAFAGQSATAVLAASYRLTPEQTARWDNRTVAAYHAYERHQSGRRFARMAADATHADAYLRTDVGTWARDRARHAPAATLRADAYYVWLDVTQPAD